MSQHRYDFVVRVPAPEYEDNSQYRRIRHETYNTDKHYFPTQRAFEAQRAIDEGRARGDAIRTTYFSERDRERGYVASLEGEEQQYYGHYNRITPKGHRQLINPAREYLASELDTAMKRERLYVETPLAYDTLENQTRHHNHIVGHYGQADTADRFLGQHLRFAEYVVLPFLSLPAELPFLM
ncbi:MAG: hypothetical protein LQ341_003460 [Variospora aurantia]|nr:MAG: hypothetical protein LQ341_003460 [Variospora aurantia]